MRQLILSAGMGFSLPIPEQIEAMARIGWDGFFTGWNDENGIAAYAAKAKEVGAFYQSVHAPYHDVYRLWEEGEDGEKEADKQIACLRDCEQNGVSTVVMHAIIGFDRHTPADIGIDRFGRIFDEAERLGIRVALENTEGECYLEKLMRHFASHKAVGFCIDTGHELCYNIGRDLISTYGEKLIATHINDNLGCTGEAITWLDDAHLMPFDGKKDWADVAKRMKAVGYDGPLTFELTSQNKPDRHTHDRYASLDFNGFASLALEKARRFRNLLEA